MDFMSALDMPHRRQNLASEILFAIETHKFLLLIVPLKILTMSAFPWELLKIGLRADSATQPLTPPSHHPLVTVKPAQFLHMWITRLIPSLAPTCEVHNSEIEDCSKNLKFLL